MAYTREDLEAVNKAIASGVLKVRYGDKEVQYPSINDLIRAKQHIVAELNAESGRRKPWVFRIRNKGKGV